MKKYYSTRRQSYCKW